MAKASLVSAGFLLLSLGPPAARADAPPFVPLFDGKTLQGFHTLGGAAKYTVKDGAIVGQTVPNTKNTFLSTDKSYGDFVLELSFKVDPRLNSGVQIRGQSRPDYQDGRVHGYQIEIDPDVQRGRLWTGGFYDEGRRGWLQDMSGNAAARGAFRANDWNHLRVEAVGDSVKTFLNGIPAADAVDPMDTAGFIGLQVHQVGKREEPLYVSWRDIRLQDLGRRAWRPLLGTKALAGFHAAGGGAWKVEEGGVIAGSTTRGEARSALLFFDTPLGDFTARAEVRLTGGPGSNGGIYLGAEPANTPAGARGLQIDLDAGSAGGLYETGGRGWLRPSPDAADKKNKAASSWKTGAWVPIMVSARGGRVTTWVGGYRAAELVDLARRPQGLLALELNGGADARLEVRKLEVLSEAIPPPVPGYPIGWCIRAKGSAPDDAVTAGFEYVELALQDVLDLPDAAFAEAATRFEKLGIPALTGYNFLPDDLKVVGPDADVAKQDAHLARALPRLQKLGLKYVVWNSGPSRRAPEGLPREKAWKDLVAFGKRFARAAGKHGLTVLVQPLRSTDTNMVTKVGEALELVKAVGARNFAMLVDYSFMTIEKEDPAVLRKAGKALRHVWISNPNGRGYPMDAGDADYTAFFSALQAIDYRGGISVHARTDNFFADAPRALRFLRQSTTALARPAAAPTARK
jgi:sugar phosphate isomerase/epimerase